MNHAQDEAVGSAGRYGWGSEECSAVHGHLLFRKRVFTLSFHIVSHVCLLLLPVLLLSSLIVLGSCFAIVVSHVLLQQLLWGCLLRIHCLQLLFPRGPTA